jgi:hypothetical protein
VQPLGAGFESPTQPSAAFIEAANEHEQIVGGGVESGGEGSDGLVQGVD